MLNILENKRIKQEDLPVTYKDPYRSMLIFKTATGYGIGLKLVDEIAESYIGTKSLASANHIAQFLMSLPVHLFAKIYWEIDSSESQPSLAERIELLEDRIEKLESEFRDVEIALMNMN